MRQEAINFSVAEKEVHSVAWSFKYILNVLSSTFSNKNAKNSLFSNSWIWGFWWYSRSDVILIVNWNLLVLDCGLTEPEDITLTTKMTEGCPTSNVFVAKCDLCLATGKVGVRGDVVGGIRYLKKSFPFRFLWKSNVTGKLVLDRRDGSLNNSYSD